MTEDELREIELRYMARSDCQVPADIFALIAEVRWLRGRTLPAEFIPEVTRSPNEQM